MSLSDDAYNCCPFCGGQGYTVVTDSYGEPEQEQCRFCYETAYPLSKRIAELEALYSAAIDVMKERANKILELETENQRLHGEFELTWYALRNNQVSIGDRIDNALKIIKQVLWKEA